MLKPAIVEQHATVNDRANRPVRKPTTPKSYWASTCLSFIPIPHNICSWLLSDNDCHCDCDCYSSCSYCSWSCCCCCSGYGGELYDFPNNPPTSTPHRQNHPFCRHIPQPDPACSHPPSYNPSPPSPYPLPSPPPPQAPLHSSSSSSASSSIAIVINCA